MDPLTAADRIPQATSGSVSGSSGLGFATHTTSLTQHVTDSCNSCPKTHGLSADRSPGPGRVPVTEGRALGSRSRSTPRGPHGHPALCLRPAPSPSGLWGGCTETASCLYSQAARGRGRREVRIQPERVP